MTKSSVLTGLPTAGRELRPEEEFLRDEGACKTFGKIYVNPADTYSNIELFRITTVSLI